MPHSETKQDQLNRCPDARGLLPDYVEGELSSVEARRLEGHLALCSACRLEESRYRAAFTTLKAPRPLAPHGDLSAGLAAKLAKYERRSGSRQFQLRWAGAFCLMLAVGGASASFMRTYISAPSPINITANSQASTPPLNTGDLPKQDHRQGKVQIPVKPAPEPAFEFKNEEPKSDVATQRDPFDPKGLSTPPSQPATSIAKADRSQSERVQNRNTVASNERERFLSVQPHEGHSAEEIIVQKRHEETVAQYSAPSANPGDDGQPLRIIRPDDKNEVAAGPTAPGNPNENDPGVGAPVQPVAVLAEKDSEIDVNGKKTNVRSALGYDKSGRPVLVKVNIAPKRNKRIEK